jgi:hypothetical protein
MTEVTPLEELDNEPKTPVIETNLGDVSKENEGDKPDAKVIEEKEKAKNRLSDNLKKATYNWREEERKNAVLQAEVERLRKATEIKKEPDQDEYTDFEKYQQDKQAYKEQEKARLKEELAQEMRAEQQERIQRAEAEKIAKEYGKQRALGAKNFDNWYEHEHAIGEVVQKAGAWTIRDIILDSDKGAALVNYLGTHEEELAEIATLPMSAQTRRLLRIEAKLGASPAKKVSSAPDPVSSVKGSANVSVNPSNETTAEYIRRKNFG